MINPGDLRLPFRVLPTAFCLLFSVFCLLSSAHAQTTGGVKGKVRNMRGESVAGATIIARQNSKDIASAKSGNKGEFLLDGLETGLYNIVFEAKGYSSGIKHNVEVRKNKNVDLGERLFLQTDQGTQVIVRGSVFYKDGTSVQAAKVEIEKLSSDGTTRKIGTVYTNISGEFTFKQPEGAAKFRITAKHKGSTAGKDIEVDSAAIYRLAISLDAHRQ